MKRAYTEYEMSICQILHVLHVICYKIIVFICIFQIKAVLLPSKKRMIKFTIL